MGLFRRSESESNFAGGKKNALEFIQREMDTNTLISFDPRVNFNTNSYIEVAQNEQVIFIKNGEFMGMLPPGRHEIQTENYPVLSRIRNFFSGGESTFTCSLYHVNTNIQKVQWGTSSAIEIQDFFLGGGVIGVPTLIRGAGEFLIRFNVRENDNASFAVYKDLMGDQSTFTTNDLSSLFVAQFSQEICDVVGKTLEARSRQQSINAISSQIKDFAGELTPTFNALFGKYGFELVNFSFRNLTIDETDERKKYLDRLIATAHTGCYDKAIQQELLKDLATNQGTGSIASAGAGLGMGLAAGNAFGELAAGAFSTQQYSQVYHQSSHPYLHQQAFTQPAPAAQPDPMETLSKIKQMLDAGLITQEQYDKKVAEVMSRM